MPEEKELWIEAEDSPGVMSGDASTLVIRAEPHIHFLKGFETYGAPETPGYMGRSEYSTPTVTPVPKKVASYWKKMDCPPNPASLIHFSIDPEVLPGTKAKLKAGSKTLDVDLDVSDSGVYSKKLYLFVYGDGPTETFPDVVTVDVSKSGDAGFETSVEFQAGTDKRKLGLIDLLIKDPEDGKFRSACHGLFKTRTPSLKLICPGVGANNMEVFLDDGDDNGGNSINITGLIDPHGDLNDCPDVPLALEEDSDKATGAINTESMRSRRYDEAPEEGKNLGLFLYGENRLRVKDKASGDELFEAFFFLYLDDEETVPGIYYGNETVTVDDVEHEIAKNHLMLDFKDSAKDADISHFLNAVFLRPQGFMGTGNIVQAAPHGNLSGSELKELGARLKAHGAGVLEDAGLDFMARRDDSSNIVMERYADAMQTDFQPATGDFGNAFQWFFHHFYMHTFPAHRLIDRVRFPTADPPSVTLEGAHYELNKTFVLPTAKDTLFLVRQTKSDHPSRKIAVFAHTDSTGTDAHNNALSRLRGGTAHALLVKDPDVWLHKLDGTPVVTEAAWGIREIQFMLKTLGFYTGTVDGVNGNGTKQASRDFLASVGLPASAPGNLDNPARRRLIVEYMNNMMPTAMGPGDFHQDGAGAPAVFGCGEAFLLLPAEPTSGENRRVTFVLRQAAPVPIDLTQEGAAVPFRQWVSPEAEAAALADDNPPFVVACYDSGFGSTGAGGITDNYSGDLLNARNRLFIQGRRLIRPTLIAAAATTNQKVFQDGDLSKTVIDPVTGNPVNMSDLGNDHGSGVMSCMTGDGIGDEIGGVARTIGQIVLGTGKDVKFRPIRQFAADFLTSIRTYQLVRSDADVKVVSSSLLFEDVTVRTAAQQTQLKNAIKAMLDSGKIYFIAAANVNPANVAKRDAKRTEGGFVAPQRSQKRSSFTGANAFKRNIAVIGATSRVINAAGVHAAGLSELPARFTFLGDEVNIAAPGTDIRVMIPSVPGGALFGGTQPVNGVFMRNISGTSFATPMTAGVAGEMLLVNPRLQQAANLPKVIEMLEATADLIPPLTTAPAAGQQGLFLPGAANADPNLVAPGDLTGFRRINFWKAILAAVNEGLPTEQQIPNPAGGGNIAATSHFDQLVGKDHAATTWYGFEIRTKVQNARIWLKRADGTFTLLRDTGAAQPGDLITGSAWKAAQDLRAPAASPQAGFHLANFPFTGAPPANVQFWFMAQFSALREELARFAEIRVYSPDIDPLTAAHRNAPALSVMDLAQITRMRNPGAITGAERGANIVLDQIATHIQEFDDFVFHWTIAPQAHDAFVLVHEAGVNAGEEMRVFLFAIDKFGNVKTDFPFATVVNLTHNGTVGSTAAGVNHGVFIDGNPAGASTPLNLANGAVSFRLKNFNVENFTLHAAGGGKNDNGTQPQIQVGPPGAIASIRVEVTHFDGRSVEDNQPQVEDRLKYTVTILDNQNRTKTDFTGRVDLEVAEGTMGEDVAGGAAPFKRGVMVNNSQNDAFDAAHFRHDFVAGDAGKFEYSVFNFTTGDVVLRAVSGGVTGTARRVTILGGVPDHIDFVHPPSVAAGNGFNLEMRPKDRFGNLITDFEGRVDLTVQPAGMAGAIDGAGVKSGVFIGETQTAADDHYQFVHADQGVHSIPIKAYTAGNFQIQVASAGMANQTTPSINVTGGAALNSFRFTMGTSQHRGVFFPVIVTALDVGGNVISNFAGNVQLTTASGSAPTISGSPHAFAAGDNGSFSFDVRANLNGALALRAISGTIQSTSPTITVT